MNIPHRLRLELGRYTNPVTPLSYRECVYCKCGGIDNEKHFILFCKPFETKRQCFFGRLRSLYPDFVQLTDDEMLTVILCPSTANMAKCVSKYLGIMTLTRKEIDFGLNPDKLELYIEHKV